MIALLRFCVFCLAVAAPICGVSEEPRELRLLFAGSSSTYWNDMPREVARLVSGHLAGKDGMPVVPEIVGRSGSDIRVYSEPGFNRYEYGVKPGQTFAEKLRDERPDFVVLQVVCGFIMQEPDSATGQNLHAEAITKYCEWIRAAGGEPVFYEMGWGKGPRETEGRQRIFELARRNKVRWFVPCSTAWARVYDEKPELALQHPRDASHPGDAGHFLNLACFYASLTEQSPVGRLPRKFPVWPHAMGKPETEEAKAAEAARVSAFEPDAYQAKMPRWMRRNMSMNLTAELDEATASYLETVAWETWQKTSKQLKE